MSGGSVLRRILALLPVLALAVSLSSCDTIKDIFNQTTKKAPLKGDRIPVMVANEGVTPDKAVVDTPIQLPAQIVDPDWPQSGGVPSHLGGSLALNKNFKRAWSTSIGEGKSRAWKHLAVPVVAHGRVYTMDTESVVRAFDAKDGNRIWSTDVHPEGDVGDGDVGGGLAYADGMLYVTNNYGEVLELDAATGAVKWRRALGGPTRAAPTIADGRVFAVTADNQLHALDAKTGTVDWTHSGLSEVTTLLGGASPAYDNNVVIVPYSSGEIYALRSDNGREIWSDTLAAIRRVDSILALADIRANPVIDRDLMIAIGHSGRMVAIDMRSGGRAWDNPIGGISMPWVAGDYVFVVTNENQIVCVTRQEGRVRWVTQLDLWTDQEDKTDPVVWLGPVLAGDELILASNNSRILVVSPYTGQVLTTINTDDPVTVPPIVADRTLYVLTDAGDLKAYR
jgi:outer membrane protein assembly factor BamB